MAEAGLRLVAALYMGARNMASVAVTCAGAGIIVGIVTLTGVGLNLSGIVVDLSAGNLYLGLFLTMVACLILGMGVPTTPTYIIMATLTAPALIAVGRENGLEIPIIAVHLFVFYFGPSASQPTPLPESPAQTPSRRGGGRSPWTCGPSSCPTCSSPPPRCS